MSNILAWSDFWESFDRDKTNRLKDLPRCECCGEPITTERAFYHHDLWYCLDCELEFWDAIREDFLESVEN